MQTNNLTHFVFVDFENVPGVDLSALGEHSLCVTLFLGVKSKLKANLIEQISTLPFEVRLIKVTTSKKNLLDFVLTFHLGELVSRYPRGHFYIVSGDRKDFDPVVAHLKGHHLHVSLHPDIASLPFLKQPKSGEQPPSPVLATAAPTKIVESATSTPATDRRAKVIAHLTNPTNKNRPKTLKGLRAHIKNALGKDSTSSKVEAAINELRSLGLNEAKGKVTYPSQPRSAQPASPRA